MSAIEPEGARGLRVAGSESGDDGDLPDDETPGDDPADEPPPEAA